MATSRRGNEPLDGCLVVNGDGEQSRMTGDGLVDVVVR